MGLYQPQYSFIVSFIKKGDTMAIDFEFYNAPDPTGDNPETFYARPVISRTVGTEEICSDIQYASSLTMVDIKAVLAALSDAIIFHMGQSHRIYLEGIGYFQPTLKVMREVVPDKTRAQSVCFKSITYRPDTRIVKYLADVETRRAVFKVHSDKLTTTEVDKMVTEYLQSNDYITRAKMEKLCRLTRSTTQRHITRMLSEGKLSNKGTRKQPLYVLK